MTLLASLQLASADLGDRPRRLSKKASEPELKRLKRQISAAALGDRIDGVFALERALRTVLDKRLNKHGLTYAQYALLRFINAPRDAEGYPSADPVGPGEIQAYFGLQKRAVSLALGQLEKKRLVSTQRGINGDRRRTRLCLTGKAEKTLEQATVSVRYVAEALGWTTSREQDYASWFLIPRMLQNVQRIR